MLRPLILATLPILIMAAEVAPGSATASAAFTLSSDFSAMI
jgi:hypothetical protein